MSVSVWLGSETDDILRKRLAAALRRLGARRKFDFWGLGGSQEVSRVTYRVLGQDIVVERETYVGVTLIGEDRLVSRIQDALAT